MLSEALRRYKIPKIRVVSFIAICSAFTLIISMEMIEIMTRDSLLSTIIPVLVVIAIIIRGLQYYPRKLMEEKTYYTSKAFPVTSYLVLRYSVSESITDSIKEIANKNLGRISKDFKEILDRVIKGNHPRRVLEEYAKNIPSEVFKEGLLSFLSLTQQERLPSKYVLRSFRATVSEQLREMEIKTTLFVTFLFFLPVLTLIFVMVNGLPDYYMIIAPIIQVILAELVLYHLLALRG